MHRYEGVGFPLKLAETLSSVDRYLGLRQSCILMTPAGAQDNTEYTNQKEEHSV